MKCSHKLSELASVCSQVTRTANTPVVVHFAVEPKNHTLINTRVIIITYLFVKKKWKKRFANAGHCGLATTKQRWRVRKSEREPVTGTIAKIANSYAQPN